MTKEQESLLNGTQQKWTQPVYVKTTQDLISTMDDNPSKIFNASKGKFGSQWLNVVPCKNLGLKLDDQQLRNSNGLRLGATVRSTVVKELKGKNTRSFLHQQCWSLLTSCHS